MAKRTYFLTLFAIATLLVAGVAVATEQRCEPVVEVHEPGPADAVLEAVELELGSRLVGVAPGEARRVARALVVAARKAGFDPWYIMAIIEVESAYDANACSPVGARGLMQLMPSTFRSVSNHYRASEPVENVRAGIAYLSKLYASGFRRPTSILLAYNGGPSNAIAYGKAARAGEDLSSFPQEMREYPHLVLKRYLRLRAAHGDARPSYKTWRKP